MKKPSLAKKERLGLTKKTIVKLSSGALNFGGDQTVSSTSDTTGAALVAFLTQ